jgi:hypothetical protein
MIWSFPRHGPDGDFMKFLVSYYRFRLQSVLAVCKECVKHFPIPVLPYPVKARSRFDAGCPRRYNVKASAARGMDIALKILIGDYHAGRPHTVRKVETHAV